MSSAFEVEEDGDTGDTGFGAVLDAVGVLVEPDIVADGGVLGVIVVAKVGGVVVLALGQDDGQGEVGGGEVVAGGYGGGVDADRVGTGGEAGDVIGAGGVGGVGGLAGIKDVI